MDYEAGIALAWIAHRATSRGAPMTGDHDG